GIVSSVKFTRSPTEPDGLSLSENVTLARSTPNHSPYKADRSPNGPPTPPCRMLSRAAACPSDAPSSRTTPIFHPPAVRFDGNQLMKAKSTPKKSVSSSFPAATWNTATPRHSPFGLLGLPSTGHGQS